MRHSRWRRPWLVHLRWHRSLHCSPWVASGDLISLPTLCRADDPPACLETPVPYPPRDDSGATTRSKGGATPPPLPSQYWPRGASFTGGGTLIPTQIPTFGTVGFPGSQRFNWSLETVATSRTRRINSFFRTACPNLGTSHLRFGNFSTNARAQPLTAQAHNRHSRAPAGQAA